MPANATTARSRSRRASNARSGATRLRHASGSCVIANARALAASLAERGYRIVSGGTDNHLFLLSLVDRELSGKAAEHALEQAGITTNKNTIPFETRSPFQASGVRLGTPAVTTRGMKEAEMAEIADMISEVLKDIKNVDAAHSVRERVKRLTAKFPLPY